MLNTLNEVDTNGDYKDNIFIGKVVANDDPLQLRRVKVTVPNLLEGPVDQLPWVAPMFMGFIANTPGVCGSAHLVPPIGAELTVEFQLGSLLHGLYVASPLRPSSKLSEFGGASYLHTYGWKDPAGNVFIVDTTTGQNLIRVFHASGTEFRIENDGKIKITGVADLEISTQGSTTVTSSGLVALNAFSGITVDLHGNNIAVSNGDVVVDGISVKHHLHGGVQRGSADTDPPHA